MAARRRRLKAHRAARDHLLSALGEEIEEPSRSDRKRPRRTRRQTEHSPRRENSTAGPERTKKPARTERRRQTRDNDVERGTGAGAGRNWLWWTAGWLISMVGVCVTVAVGAPTLGHSGDIRFAVAGIAAVICGAAIATGHRPAKGCRGRKSVPAVATLVTLCFVLGALNSVIIDGRPVLATSTEARAHAMVLTMEDDLMSLVHADEMIALPISEARARSREYEELAAQMESLSARWARTKLAELPTGEFAPVGTSLATASFAAAQAVESKISLLGATDARVTAEMNTFRQTLVTEVLSAGPQLVALGELYDVEVSLGAPTVRE